MISSSRRGFLRGLAGVSLLSAGGCFAPHPRKPGQKVRLAAVGIMGKGYSDWTAVAATVLTMSSTEHPRERSLQGFASPCNTAKHDALPMRCVIL